MSRKYIPILPLFAALFLTVSCDPTTNEPEQKDTLTVTPTSLSFKAEDTEIKLVHITTNGDWKASASPEWIRLTEKTSGTGKGYIAVKVDANKDEKERTGSISITGAQNVTVAVSQEGASATPHTHEGFTGSSNWTLIGTIGGDDWKKDIAMKSNGDWHGAFDIVIASGEEFKFRQNKAWDTNYGYGTATVGARLDVKQGGDNIKVPAGTYDIYLAPANGIAYILNAGDEFTHYEEGKPVTGGTLGGPYNASLDPSKKLSGITYQINVYSFADSDGDGWGDLQGIIDHLDYLDHMGATALWLSPIHPAMSYHGYDVTDYATVNPKFGGKNATAKQAEAKLQELITAAAAKSIDIYLDYVLNHAGKDHPYFVSACKNPSDEWRECFIFSTDPASDIAAGKIPMIPKTDGFDASQWYQNPYAPMGYTGSKNLHFKLDVSSASAPKLTITETEESAQDDGDGTWYIYDNNAHTMHKTSNTVYEITLKVNNDWGVLVKDHATEWGNHKWGASAGDQQIAFGTAKTLVKGDAANNLTFGQPEMYHSHMWTDWFADWNFGYARSAETSKAFTYLAGTADKWINMGVNGLRLDAVKHIYHNETNSDNPTFLKKWYDHCNATYQARGGEGNIYMVGEVFSDYAAAAPYYKGLPSLFGFSFWWTLRDRINGGKGSDFASTISGFQSVYKKNRPDYIDAIKLSNHDEDRAASDFGNNDQKKRLAAAVLLTSPGKPYVYQGEELGYWGTKGAGDDEYVRTPILWETGGSVPSGWSSKIDKEMLKTEGISVEAQSENERSLLQLYYHFAYARNTNEALADGTIEVTSSGDDAVAAWYMNSTSTSKRCLVLHNFSNGPVTVTRNNDNLTDIVVSNAGGESTITVSGNSVTLPAYSSVVFNQ